jgi:hypothetical protein
MNLAATGYDVNVRCLDAWTGGDDPHWRAAPFDGHNWEANIGSIR